MPKPSGWIRKTEAKYKAKYEAESNQKIFMAFQMGQDAAMIAANVALHMGKGRVADFAATYSEVVNEMADMLFSDLKDDKEMEYTKAKVDERLKQICGEKFQPWDVRYNGKL